MVETLRGWLAPFSKGQPQREAAIVAAATGLSGLESRQLLDLVMLAFGRPAGSSVSLVREGVREVDPGFPGRPTDAQTQLTAAWAIATAIEGQKARRQELAAMAVLSADFLGLDTRASGLVSMAARHLDWRSGQVRQRSALPSRGTTATPLAGVTFSAGSVATTDQLTQTVAAIRDALAGADNRHDRFRQAVGHQLSSLGEEAAILWWAFGQGPEGPTPTWATTGAAAGILAGLDLADLSQFATPPPFSTALLERALSGCGSVTLLDAAQAAKGHADRASNELDHPLLPVSAALRDPEDAATDVERLINPVELGEQMLRERLMEALL